MRLRANGDIAEKGKRRRVWRDATAKRSESGLDGLPGIQTKKGKTLSLRESRSLSSVPLKGSGMERPDVGCDFGRLHLLVFF